MERASTERTGWEVSRAEGKTLLFQKPNDVFTPDSLAGCASHYFSHLIAHIGLLTTRRPAFKQMQTTNVVVGTPINTPIDVSDASTSQPRPAALERRQTMTNILLERGWPSGLTHAVATSVEAFPVRLVIVDNSGSMQRMDGTRLVRAPSGDIKPIKASRWAELGDVVMELTEAVTSLGAETHFHLLNPTPAGQYFVVADDGHNSHISKVGAPADVSTIKRVMSTSPMSTTPLTEAVQTCISVIAPAAEKLRAHGQQVVVVLATDGVPNEPTTFLSALRTRILTSSV